MITELELQDLSHKELDAMIKELGAEKIKGTKEEKIAKILELQPKEEVEMPAVMPTEPVEEEVVEPEPTPLIDQILQERREIADPYQGTLSPVEIEIAKRSGKRINRQLSIEELISRRLAGYK